MMLHLFALIIAFKILLVFPVGMTLKILMIQPNYASIRSHFAFGLSLAKFLSKNDGHEVHLLMPIGDDTDKMSDKNDEQNLNVRYFMTKYYGRHRSKAGNKQNGPPPKDMTFIDIATDATLMDALSAEKFDIGIAEAFQKFQYSFAIFHFLRIPATIATSAMPILPHQFYLLGLLSKMASANVPAAFGPKRPNIMADNNVEQSPKWRRSTMIGDHQPAQLKSKATEIWSDYVESTMERIKEHIETDPLYQQVAEDRYPFNFFPGWDELFRKCQFFLVNSQPEVDFDQYKSVNGVEKVKFIGGFNLRVPAASNGQQLDQDILRHLDDKKGIVLVSFGTVVDTTKTDYSHIIGAMKGGIKNFSEFLFVWKLSKGDANIQKWTHELSNVYTTDWVDQKGILAHPKTMAFVSHCGMNSVLEGIYNGKPMVCVPFFGDQYYNAVSLARQNIGMAVDRELDQDTVQGQLTVALAKALGLNDERCQLSGDASSKDVPIDLEKVRAASESFRQKNIGNIISEALHLIR